MPSPAVSGTITEQKIPLAGVTLEEPVKYCIEYRAKKVSAVVCFHTSLF